MSKSDKCTREMMGYSALCSLQPKSKIAQCLKEASQYHEACVSGGVSGVSSGCGNSSLGASQGFQGGHSSCHSSSDSARLTRHNGTLSNGNVYNNGILVAARGSNGLTYTIKRPGPRG